MIALDTNLLVYAHRESVPEHGLAQAAVECAAADGQGWGIALPSVIEFWHVVTHPRAAGDPSDHQVAADFIDALRHAGARIWTPGPSLWERLSRTATRQRISGPRIFDLHIAITARDHGATEIWTHDANFIKIRGLRVHDPLV